MLRVGSRRALLAGGNLPPSGLSASGGNGSVRLSWNAVGGATSYDLQSSPDNTTWSTLAAGLTGTSYSHAFKAGAAGFVSGLSQYLSIASNSFFAGGRDFTVGAWIKPYDLTSYHVVFAKSQGNSTNTEWELRTNGTSAEIAITGGVSAQTASCAGLIINAWQFVVAKFVAATQVMTVYVNGVAGTPVTLVGTPYTGSDQVNIGARNNGTSLFFNGAIDSPFFYSRTLSGAEITALYNNGTPLHSSQLSNAQKTSLSAIYNFDPDTFLTDSSGNGNTLTNNASVASAPGADAPAAAAFASASSQYLSVASNSTLQMSGSDFSAAFWYFCQDASANKSLLGKDTTSREWGFFQDGSSKITFRFWDNASHVTTATWGSAVAVGNWYFVVGTYTDSTKTITLSVNNGAAVTTTGSFGGVWSSTDPFTINQTQLGFYNTCRIKGVCIWKGRALSGSESTTLYNSGVPLEYYQIPNSVTTPTYFWNMNGTQLVDSVAQLTLTNNAGVTSVTNIPDPVTATGLMYYRVRANNAAGSSSYASAVNASPYKVYDQFSGTNGTLLSAHTIAPVNTPAVAWSEVTHAFTLQSNQARPNLVSSEDEVEALSALGITDAVILCDVMIAPDQTDLIGSTGFSLHFRRQDGSNYLQIQGDPRSAGAGGAVAKIWQNVAGVFTALASASFTWTAGSTYTLKAVFKGNSLSYYINDVLIASVSTSQFATQQGAGLRDTNLASVSATGTRFDNYRVFAA